MRRRLLLAALALVTLGATMLSSPAPAGAATVTKSAWWYRARTGDATTAVPPAVGPTPAGIPVVPAPPTPAPPTVPDGSLLVEGTPQGANAIAAITYSMTKTESAPTLTITPSSTSEVPADAIILACHAAVDWTAPDQNPGAWEEKPLVDCGQSVQGIAADDGTITFALAPLCQACTTLDVVLVPGTVAAPTDGTAPPVGSSFSLAFDTKAGAKIVTTQSSDGSFNSSSSFVPDSSSYATPRADYSAPSTYSAPVPIAQPALEPQEQAPSVPRQAALPAATPVKDDKRAQGVAFLILLAGLAFAGLAYATPDRTEEGLVGLGRFRRPAPPDADVVADEPVPGGLGRFTKPRTGPPPALS